MFRLGVLGVIFSGAAFGQEADVEALDETVPEVQPAELLQEPGSVPKDPLAFARQLRELGQDATAYAEFLRVADANPSSFLADQALYEAGAGAMQGLGADHHYLWAAEQVRPELRGQVLLLSQEAIYLDVVTLWGGDRYTFEESMSDPALAPWADSLAYMQGWIQLVDREESAAVESFGSIEDPTLKPRSQELVSAIEGRDIRQRSKVVAGMISSLLPGGGQIYAGEVEGGVTSMLLTGLAGLGTWSAYRDGQFVLTGVAGLGAIVLYVKQITGAVSAAENYNDMMLEEWRHELHAASVLQVELVEGDGETHQVTIELGEAEQ